MKHRISYDFITFSKVAWARVVKFVEIGVYSTEALIGFDKTWSVRNIHCRQDSMKIMCNWNNNVSRLFGTLVTWWFGGCPWLLGSMLLFMWQSKCAKGLASP